MKVTELQDLSSLDQQLQTVLDVVQEHGKNWTVQRAAFTAVWNLIVCSKARSGSAEHDDSAPTVAIQRMIIAEALSMLDVDYTATAKRHLWPSSSCAWCIVGHTARQHRRQGFAK